MADPSQESCLIKCSDPVSFTGWRETLAFGLCYSSRTLCLSLEDAIGGRDALSAALYSSVRTLMYAKPSMVHASLFFFGITFVNLLQPLASKTYLHVSVPPKT
jgi:hypothetical protein